MSTKDLYIKYLKIYNSEFNKDGTPVDWEKHLGTLQKQVSRRDPSNAVDARRKQAACAILLPYYDRSVISDPPENLLLSCHKFHQFNDRDWQKDFDNLVAKDAKIVEVRSECLEIGVVYPLEFYPTTRQAYRWLKEASIYRGDWNDDSVGKFKNFVLAYGGSVISNVFEKPELRPRINKILNWRTPYFFEHLIFETYKPEQILKIKDQEIQKVSNSDPNLVKILKV